MPNKKRALLLGGRYNQEGIFDLARTEYIETGGSGEPPESMPPLMDRLPPLRRRKTRGQGEEKEQ